MTKTFKYIGPWIYLFLGINIALYFFIFFFQDKISFNIRNYTISAHHYLVDARSRGGSFDFLRALGQFDAQWYLKIAEKGYPENPQLIPNVNKDINSGLSYAFFPLYPLLLSLFNTVINNIELTAFAVTNVLLLINFISLYYVVSQLYSEHIARKTVFLFFLFPFSIFFRSYFTEGLFLFLLIWFSYFLIQRQWFYSACFLSLLFVTRPNGLFLAPLFLFFASQEYKKNRIRLSSFFQLGTIAIFPFFLWLWFCFYYTSDPFYWFSIQSNWYNFQQFSFPLTNNLQTIFQFFSLPLHAFHKSKIEVLTILTAGALLFYSRKKIKPELWWISLLFWAVPLIFKDTMSFSRYQIISFPLFIYLATALKGLSYKLVILVFLFYLFFTSLFFVNWYWVG